VYFILIVELTGPGAPETTKNSRGEMGSPCLLLPVFLNGTEQVLPVITMAEGLT
jgi:hypothetical protein